MLKASFSILITTKNRLSDLIITLDKISYLIDKKEVSCIICDDGSTDGTFDYIKNKYPNIQLIRNENSQGLISSRNKLLALVKTDFAISLDDDAHFLSQNPLEFIENYFQENSKCGLISFRIFWGLQTPISFYSDEKTERVQSFVGCGHVWRMDAWRSIPNYPDWFVFYGEEDFASYQLFQKKWEIHYLPQVLVHHRVDVSARKSNADYTIRLRRSLRSGWYLFFLFYPMQIIPRKMAYSLWMQFKLKVFKGDFKALKAILLSLFDLIWNIPKIIKNSNRLSIEEYQRYQKLTKTKLYWHPPSTKNETL